MAIHFLTFASAETRSGNNSIDSSCLYSKTFLSELQQGGSCCLLVILWRLGGIPTMGTHMIHLHFHHTLEKYSLPVFKYICSFIFLPQNTVSLLWDPKILYMLLSLKFDILRNNPKYISFCIAIHCWNISIPWRSMGEWSYGCLNS